LYIITHIINLTTKNHIDTQYYLTCARLATAKKTRIIMFTIPMFPCRTARLPW